MLSSEQVATFEATGACAVPGLLSDRELSQLADWVGELEAAPSRPGGVWKYDEDHRIEYFRRFHAGLGEWMDRGPLAQAVASLLGEPAVLFKDKVNLKPAGGAGFTPHQDAQAGWEDYAPLHVSVALAVDEVTVENGCLELAPGRRLRALIGERWRPLEGAALASLRFEPVPMRPGDALFFDSFVPHQSGSNRSQRGRRILYLTYNAAAHGDHYEAYFTAKRASYPPDIERLPGREYRFKV